MRTRLATAALLGIFLSACGGPAATQPGGDAGSPVRGGTLKVALEDEFRTLDPHRSTALIERQVFYNMFDSLVTIDKSLKIVPALAESWEISADSKSYVFRLRKNVKFHDGTPFDAEAVRFNIMDHIVKATRNPRQAELASIQNVEVVDPSTVRFVLKNPFAPLLANLVDRAGMMLSPAAVKAGGENFVRAPLGAGTGPFKFVEWKKDDHLTLERNPNYWLNGADGKPLPYLDKVIYRPISDETVALTNLRSSSVDVIQTVPPKDVQSLRSGTGLGYQETAGLGFESFRLNNSKEPFTNKALRQAVAWSVDREQIRKTAWFGTGVVGYGPTPPPVWAYDPAFKPYSRDLTKARQKLQEGGKPNGFSFSLEIRANSPRDLDIAQLFQSQLKEVLIQVQIAPVEFAKILTDLDNHTYQAAQIGWSGRIDPDGNLYQFFKTGAAQNDTVYSNPRIDALLDQARIEQVQSKRKDLYRQIEQILADDAPYVFYRFRAAYLATTNRVHGIPLNPDQILRWGEAWIK